MKIFNRAHLATLIALTMIPTLFSCGKSSYDPVTKQSQTDAPGTYDIPAKMDILLAVDDTGSALNANIQGPLTAFMANLNSQNWDFRVAAIPLTQVKAVSQVAVSKYDIKSGSSYKEPYPGAIRTGSSIAVFPSQLLLPGANPSKGEEKGIDTVVQTLEQEALYLSGGTRFLRPDALTVIIIISTSDDTSEGAVKSSSPIALSTSLVDRIRTAKGYDSALGTKVYAFVNTSSGAFGNYSTIANCLGQGNSFAGMRYQQLALATGGRSFDVCSGDVGAIFTALNDSINIDRKSYVSEYAFVSSVPELSTVVMTRINEDGSTTTIPQASSSSKGGWTYLEGYQTNLPSISYPVKMNYRSGYAFKLSGDYVLKGAQKVKVDFKTRGLQNSQ